MSKKIISIIFLLMIFILPILSQDEGSEEDDYMGVVAYSKGEQVFSINIGPIFPLFTIAPFHVDDESLVSSLSSTNIGLAGSLKLGFFTHDNFMLGGELSGMFATTYNRVLAMIPLSFVTSYYFIKYPFEFPVYLNLGISMNTLGDFFKVTPLIKPGAGAYWNLNDDWALGLNFDYWFLPELYFWGNNKDESRIANFLQFNLSAVYHF